jgi:hypothetical protein
MIINTIKIIRPYFESILKNFNQHVSSMWDTTFGTATTPHVGQQTSLFQFLTVKKNVFSPPKQAERHWVQLVLVRR